MPTNARRRSDEANSRTQQFRPVSDPTTESSPLEVPLLPLQGNVVFPRSIHPLTLYGDQALRLVRAAQNKGSLVALFLERDLAPNPPHQSDLHRVGTLARIDTLEVSESATIEISVLGLERVQLADILQWEPFVLARLNALPSAEDGDEGTEQLFSQVHDLYTGLLAGNPAAAEAMQDALDQTTRAEDLAYLVAATLPLSPQARQAILELDTGREKLLQLVPLLTRAHEINANKLSEQSCNPNSTASGLSNPDLCLKGQETLSRDPAAVDRIELQSRLQELELPESVRRTAERELDRLAGLTPVSPDYSIVRGYLQVLADLPWASAEEPELDLEAARAILDRDHYGLADVKERILEYLAVRKLRSQRRDEGEFCGQSASAPGDPVLCLVGPPGIGKTSLGRSVAEALGRPFVRISLGGISDEAEIRGHRRTYVGAMPGKIIQSLARASTSHPVIMLDELDKVGSGAKGDPAAALLEVLDPEQQRGFLDHYLDVPYDLSQVFFIVTANMLDNVPPALRDRLEVIQLSGYTEEEKVQIGLRHIVPRQMEWHALTIRDIDWREEAVVALVRSYTREAGARQLEREVATVCRRVATMVAQTGSGRPYVVDTDFVSDVLGTPRYVPERAEVSDQPGVVTGVVWTPVGGDIIHVEASIMPGSKTLTITGQIGEVMRESAQAALSYVRAEASSLGIDEDFFEHHDVHLHVPSGAVPKDGPSAGITMATALISLLTGRAVTSTAMTGEITLRGRVLPVGGVKEKILAARRAGIRLLILPAQNKRDLESIPPELLEGLDFSFADNMQEVLEAAFSGSGRSSGQRGKQARKRVRSDLGEGEEELPRAAKRR